MLSYAALMTGQRGLAVRQIQAMVASLPTEFVQAFSPMVEGFGAMPDEVMVRFGMWDEILAAPQPDKDYMPYTNAFHHGARAIAYAAKDKTAEARAEQAMWLMGIKKIPDGEVFHNNPMPAICSLAIMRFEPVTTNFSSFTGSSFFASAAAASWATAFIAKLAVATKASEANRFHQERTFIVRSGFNS